MSVIRKPEDITGGPGYFRIGFIQLDIPPQDISTTRVANNDEVIPLRSPYAMPIKSGQSRWDVTLRWTALGDDLIGYEQWEDVRYIAAFVKCAPFIEIENAHLRQFFTALDPSNEHARLAFALRQLRVETSPDIVNGLVCTLTMTYFNYYPYSRDFGYLGADGKSSVDAYQSPSFKLFVDTWIAGNFTTVREGKDLGTTDFPAEKPWQQQAMGTLEMRWRLYDDVPIIDANPPQPKEAKLPSVSDQKTPAPTPVNPTIDQTSPRTAPKKDGDLISRLGVAAQISSAKYGIPASVTVAQALLESSFGRSRLTVTANNWFGIKAVGSQPFVVLPTKEVIKGRTVTVDAKFRVFGSLEECFDAHGQFLSTIRYRRAKKLASNPYEYAYEIQRAGYATDPDYAVKLQKLIQEHNLIQFDDVVLAGKAPAIPGASSFAAISVDAPVSTVSRTVAQVSQEKVQIQALETAVNSYAERMEGTDWVLDHFTDNDAFFYLENVLSLTDSNHDDGPNDLGLYPQQFAILFSNNLAQLTLQSYQYPTYQHIGPASTVISIGMMSEGIVDGDSEPQHLGVQELTKMAHSLEEQFQRMKTKWRKVSSVHRMQAVRVYNQLLNMLGVHAVIINDASTMTIPDSSNVIQVQLTTAQYENIFEEVGSYLVKGSRDAYVKPFTDYMQGDITAGLSQQEKNGISQVVKFQQAMKDGDITYLQGVIDQKQIKLLEVPSSVQLTPAQQVSVRSLITNPAPVVNTRASAEALIDAQMAEEIRTGKSKAVPVGTVAAFQDPGKSFSLTAEAIHQDFPQYVDAISSHSQLSTTDLIFLSYLQSKVQGSNPARDKDMADVLAALKTEDSKAQISKIYLDLLAQKMQPGAGKDALFSNQMQQIINSPSFQEKYKAAVQQGGPAVNNVGHGCYRDMGIEDLSLNPGSYFVDYGIQYRQEMQKSLSTVVSSSKQLEQSVNKNTTPRSTTLYSSDTLSKEVDEMLLTMQAPESRMGAAFPTFKLFLLEEDNLGTFFAYDNFYSYASVTEIEIIRYRDRPHQAIIQLTNLAHLLSHKIYDDTTIGKRERDLEVGKLEVPASDGPVSGPAAGAISGGRLPDGTNYQRLKGKNRTEGYGKGGNQIPLAYYPLAPGNKIEIRFGFSNNPDELFRVFAGTIAEIDGQEIMTIKAQGFQAELVTAAPDKIKTDSWLSFEALAKGLLGGKGPAMGGWATWGDSGDVGSVIQNMLTCSSARHFGHWQADSNASNLMRGYSWQRLTGDILSILGSDRIAPALQDSYDRSGQNVLINHVINQDATVTKTRGAREFFDQVASWSPGAAAYHIPDGNKAPWEFIRDISRRYPEYILAVKDYGFPHGADATLVFAHPRDSYYSRPLSYDESRVEAQADSRAEAEFRAWWTSIGTNVMRQAVVQALKVAPWLIAGMISGALAGDHPVVNNFQGILPDRGQIEADTISAKINAGGVKAFDKFFEELPSKLVTPSVLVYGTFGILGNQGQYDQVFREFLVVQRMWQAYRDARLPGKYPVLKPVRKYHFVDPQSIVHNGIEVNDEIFNAVRVNGTLYPANQNIPGQYLRVLNVDQLIIDPTTNASSGALPKLYAQSFLKEELGKMYRGELVLRGMPSIEPYDVILLVDPGTGMSGPVVVDKVIHSFSQETGHISIVTPMAFVSINETSGKDWVKQIMLGFTEPNNIFKSALDEFVRTDSGGQAAALAAPGAAAGATAITIAGAQAAITTGTTVAAGVTGAASVETAGAAAAAAINPVSWWVLGVASLVAAGGLTYVIGQNESLNPVLISPLSRFGRPWVGGLQGFEIANWFRMVHNKWTNFEYSEIEPLLLSYKVARGYLESTQ
jgi:flagellum-specific peptidoglycan hydrolase FlgJ